MHCCALSRFTNNTIGSIRTTFGILQEKYAQYYALGMELKKHIGKKIAAARKAKGLDQFQLAERCGFLTKDGEPAQGRISHYETGRSPLSMELFELIAGALEMTPDELWSFGDPIISESALSGAEAGLIVEFRHFDAESKQDLLDEVEKIKKRILRRQGIKAWPAGQKSAKGMSQ